MPKLKSRVPKLSLHKSDGQGCVYLNRRCIYLGVYGKPDTVARYHRLIAEWEKHDRQLPPEEVIAACLSHRRATPPSMREVASEEDSRITIVEIVNGFRKHGKTHYRHPDGTPTGEHENFLPILRLLKNEYGELPAEEFGPRALKALRQKLIDKDLSRTYINTQISRTIRVFRWAASEELIEESILRALRTVSGLRAGRSKARERDPVKPVPQEHVDAVQPFVSRQLWSVVQLQLLTAARPGEILKMRPCDVDRSADIWEYTPSRHKSTHRGQQRIIYLGPQAQAVLKPFLEDRPLTAFVFSPKEAEEDRHRARHANRTTPLSCGNTPGSNKKEKRKRPPGEAYDTHSYGHAIAKACKKAEVPGWAPNQLRHAAATHLRRQYGIETARIILGHQLGSSVTEVYAEADLNRARTVMSEIG